MVLTHGDIRKWFIKQHDKGNDKDNSPKPAKPELSMPGKLSTAKDASASSSPTKSVQGGQESSGRRKTSRYFGAGKQNQEDVAQVSGAAAKRKLHKSSDDVKPPPVKKQHMVKDEDDGDSDDDFVPPKTGIYSVESTPSKKLKSASGEGVPRKESDEADGPTLKSGGRGRGKKGGSVGGRTTTLELDDDNEDEVTKEVKSGGRGRGRGGRGGSAAPGAGHGGFMPFGERKPPPHKGEKEVPEGYPDCLAGLTFVISGTLDSLKRDEASDLIKRYAGRVTSALSRKTTYLLGDEDVGGSKSVKAKELGTRFLTEDGLFDIIRSSNHSKVTTKGDTLPLPKPSPQKAAKKNDEVHEFPAKGRATIRATAGVSSAKQKKQTVSSLPWTEKYQPKDPYEIIGNPSLVKQIHDWLTNWNDNILSGVGKGKGNKQSDPVPKKALLLSGPPGIGKTTSAKLVSHMLGFQTIEVNASDSRGKADSKIERGINNSTANSVKELVNNQSLSAHMYSSNHPKAVLIMDEVDGMSPGDRGGVADLISSIKMSKIPIICICNDRYSQKIKSLISYCTLLTFRKPKKEQMIERLGQIAKSENLEVNEIALEELATRVNGDMRMALNQLQYMSLTMNVINYDDIKQRLLRNSKDEDISPFTAVDKLFGCEAGKLQMDERFDLDASDSDFVPLLIQENYINYKPNAAGEDEVKRMKLIARAADSLASGDIINVQVRRYGQWQLSESRSLTSSIIPAALMRGQRETFDKSEKNFKSEGNFESERNSNRFGGWLGKNSTMRKNYRLLEDVHVHLLASLQFNVGRSTLILDYLSLLLKHMTDPLKTLPNDEAVKKVVEFMDAYSISQEDFKSLMLMSKFQGRPNPLDDVKPRLKCALTKAYNKGSKSRVIRTSDLITLPGIKKAPKKRVAAMLEPVNDGDVIAQNEEDNSDAEDLEGIGDGEEKPKLDIESLSSKGIQIQTESKATGKKTESKATGTKRAPAGRGRGGGGAAAGSSSKRKR